MNENVHETKSFIQAEMAIRANLRMYKMLIGAGTMLPRGKHKTLLCEYAKQLGRKKQIRSREEKRRAFSRSLADKTNGRDVVVVTFFYVVCALAITEMNMCL